MSVEIEKREAELRKLSQAYAAAQQLVKYEKDKVLDNLCKILKQYKIEYKPESAVFVVAQAQMAIQGYLNALDTIVEYERKKEVVKKLRQKE